MSAAGGITTALGKANKLDQLEAEGRNRQIADANNTIGLLQQDMTRLGNYAKDKADKAAILENYVRQGGLAAQGANSIEQDNRVNRLNSMYDLRAQ